MAKLLESVDLLKTANGETTGVELDIGDQVQILEKLNDWRRVKTLLPDRAEGWIQVSAIDNSAIDNEDLPVVRSTLVKIEVAKQAWRSAFRFAANSHYLYAAALARSGLKDEIAEAGTGPYAYLQSEWDKLLVVLSADGTLDGSFDANSIIEWRDQVDVFAAQAAKVEQALTTALARPPSVVEIYLGQLIGPVATALALKSPDAKFDSLAPKITADDPLAGGQSFASLLKRYAPLLLQAPASAAPKAVIAQEKPVVGHMARNLRDKNPGNITISPWSKKLDGYNGPEGRFCTFKTFGQGYRAIDRLLDEYAKQNRTKIRDIIAKYAPNSDHNNEAIYVAAFAEKGFHPDDVLASDTPSRARACWVITKMEGTLTPFSVEEIKAFLDVGRTGGDVTPAAAGTIGATLALLTQQLSDAVEATRDDVIEASAAFVEVDKAAGQTTEPDETPPGGNVVLPPAPNQSFVAFFNKNLPDIEYFKAEQFLYRGAQDEKLKKNTDPPPGLWKNILYTARVLELFRKKWKEQFGRDINVKLLSIYRSPEYNRLIKNSAPNSLHMQFYATDFTCDQGSPQQWFDIIDKMRQGPRPFFLGGLHAYPAQNFVHVDTGGSNRNW